MHGPVAKTEASGAPVVVEGYNPPNTPLTSDVPDEYVWSDKEKVEYLLHRGWALNRIQRKTKLSAHYVREIVEKIDEEKIAEVAASPDKIKVRQIAYLQEVAAEAFEAYERRGNLRLFRIGMEAQAQIRKIMGLDAPEKRATLNLHEHRVIPADQQQRFLTDPKLRALQLAYEERERELVTPPPADVAREVRGGDQQRTLAVRAAPLDPQPELREPSNAGDRPASGVHASAPW